MNINCTLLFENFGVSIPRHEKDYISIFTTELYTICTHQHTNMYYMYVHVHCTCKTV